MASDEDGKGTAQPRAQTGIAGLDDITHGGLPRGHLYLLEGEPGTGKTTLALQFLMEGVRQGEPVLYVTLSESARELCITAETHGWTLAAENILELSAFVKGLQPDTQYTVFSADEVELGDMLGRIYAEIEARRPARVVVDSLTEMRLLARDHVRFRRELLGLKGFLSEREATVILVDDHLQPEYLQIQSFVHGIIRVERLANDYGADRRRLLIPKLRASRFRDGYHDYKIVTGGLTVYPRLVASEHRVPVLPGALLSGVPNLDHLLGGGLDRGTSTLVLGPAGAGKSTVAVMYAIAAAEKGERVAMYLFDENAGTLLARCRGLEMPLDRYLDTGMITLQQIDPAEMSPGEYVQAVRTAVENDDVKHVIIDSLNGIIAAMPAERLLLLQLHETLTYLNQQGITTILTTAQHGLVGSLVSPINLSYLTDTLMVLRFFEAQGEVRRAISVLKKRTGPHELTIREFRIAKGGVTAGEPLREFQGVLTGVPQFAGGEATLMEHADEQGDA